MVFRASTPGNDSAKTEKCRCGGRESTSMTRVNMLLINDGKGHPIGVYVNLSV